MCLLPSSSSSCTSTDISSSHTQSHYCILYIPYPSTSSSTTRLLQGDSRATQPPSHHLHHRWVGGPFRQWTTSRSRSRWRRACRRRRTSRGDNCRAPSTRPAAAGHHHRCRAAAAGHHHRYRAAAAGPHHRCRAADIVYRNMLSSLILPYEIDHDR